MESVHTSFSVCLGKVVIDSPLVIGAMLYRIKKKVEGMDDDKGQELVHKWHEHLDM